MEKNAMIREGMGGTTLVGDELVNTEARERPAAAPANARVKVIKLPTRIWHPRLNDWTESYLFHHYFQVHQHGRVWTTDLYSEEIVSQDIEYVDWVGNVSGACAHWGVFDFDAQQYVPSETQEFIERFGQDHEFRSFKFYRYPNRDHFIRQKATLMREIPLPHRWRSKVWGPRGAEVTQGWHIAFIDNLSSAGQPLQLREEWTGYTTFTLGKETSPKLRAHIPPSSINTPPLSEIMNAHAELEAQVGEICISLAAVFTHNPELKTLWSRMALEEGGHASLLRAVSKGLLSGAFQAKSFLLPLEVLDTLVARAAGYCRQIEKGVSLDQALRITWELECSELDFMWELLISSSNLAELGFPTDLEGGDRHVRPLREAIQRYTTDESLRHEVQFISMERNS
jgi:hypothetical protein